LPGLNRKTLSSARLNADVAAPNSLPEVRILQIGDGNFLRAFADWMVDVANGAGLMNGRITIAQPLNMGIAGKLNEQDGLYTVLLRGVQDGKEVKSKRIISCVRDSLNPYTDRAALLACVSDPALRFVVSNTTEAGIAYVKEDLTAECPQSFPAKVAALLWARFQVLGGTAKTGLVFLPCELIEANGTKLRSFVLQHAKAWKLPKAFVTSRASRSIGGSFRGRGLGCLVADGPDPLDQSENTARLEAGDQDDDGAINHEGQPRALAAQ